MWDGFWVRTRTAVRLLVTYDLEDIEEEETRRFLEDYLYITSSNTAEVRAVSQFLFAAAGPVGVTPDGVALLFRLGGMFTIISLNSLISLTV